MRPRGSWTISHFGLLDEVLDEDDANLIIGRMAIYRDGVFEWCRRYFSREPAIPTATFADEVHNALLYAARVFEQVGYTGRLRTWVRVENADHADLAIKNDFGLRKVTPESEWVGRQQEISVDDLLTDPTDSVRQAMDRIWQGFGLERCYLFASDGSWI